MWLSDTAWDEIQSNVPIVCVDVFPVQISVSGAVSAVGLIRRVMPGSDDLVWCPIGGRINHGDTLRAGVLRHLGSTLTGADFDVPADPQPAYVFQWFPAARDDDGLANGVDPRRHSVGLCFVVAVDGEPVVAETGEALEFCWFDLAEIDAVADQVWPGTIQAVRRTLPVSN
jgi:ADP-ribose pyrophosphatase YjhB (NUDIX family)